MDHCFALADVDVDFWYRFYVLLEVNDYCVSSLLFLARCPVRNVLHDMTQVGSDMALHSASYMYEYHWTYIGHKCHKCHMSIIGMCEVLLSLDHVLLSALGVASFRAVYMWKRHREGKAMMMMMMMIMMMMTMTMMMMMLVVVCAWAMLCSASLGCRSNPGALNTLST